MAETPKKQRELLYLAKKGGNDATLFLLDKINELEDFIDRIKDKILDLEENFLQRHKEGTLIEIIELVNQKSWRYYSVVRTGIDYFKKISTNFYI